VSPIVGLEPARPDRLTEWGERYAALPLWQRVALPVLGIALPLSAILLVRLHGPTGPVDRRAAVLAVFPPVPTTPDTALARLGQDLAVTLGANLDGVGGIRAADATTVLALAGVGDSVGTTDARRIARRLFATGAVAGTVTREGEAVRFDLEVVAAEGGRPFVRVGVNGDPEDVAALTDSLTRQLVAALWREEAPPAPRLAAVTSQWPPALRAFLDGERAMATGRWGLAAERYAAARTADTTFWLAYAREAEALGWAGRPVPPALVAVVRERRSRLPPLDLVLFEAQAAESLTTRLAWLDEAVRRHPDAGAAWFHLGDALVHDGPLVGRESREARTALERAAGLLPGLRPVWTHAAWASLLLGDTAGSARALAALPGLATFEGPTHPFETPAFLAAADRWMRGDTTDQALEELARVVAAARGAEARAWPYALTWLGFPAAQQRLSRRVASHGVPGEVALAHRAGAAAAWVVRGAWDSALAELDRLAGQGGEHAIAPYRVAVLGVLTTALDSSAALARRAAARRAAAGPARAAEIAWLDGVLAATRRDLPGLDAATAAVLATRDSVRVPLAYSLQALRQALEGDPRGAGRLLARLEWELAALPWEGGDDHPAFRAVNRQAGARWLMAAGDTVQARRMLVGWQRLATGGELAYSWMLAPNALIDLARLEVTGGAADRAREYYAQFLRRYDRPVERMQALVEEARAALAAPGIR
jgi:TolB-like protein